MATSAPKSAQAGELPSYEEIRKTQQPHGLSDDAWRLQWTLQDPLTSAIRIMEDKFYDPNKPLTPYCLETMPSPKWSPISQSPLTVPKISSVTVGVEQLDDWEIDWIDMHRGHASPGPHLQGNDTVRFGELSDYNSGSDEEGPDHLLRCCGGDRPRKKKVSLLVKASADFVTIHDFVTAVHPWLISLRDDIRCAAGDLLDNEPLPADAKLMIDYPRPDNVFLYDEEEWYSTRSKNPDIVSSN